MSRRYRQYSFSRPPSPTADSEANATKQRAEWAAVVRARCLRFFLTYRKVQVQYPCTDTFAQCQGRDVWVVIGANNQALALPAKTGSAAAVTRCERESVSGAAAADKEQDAPPAKRQKHTHASAADAGTAGQTQKQRETQTQTLKRMTSSLIG